MKPCAVRRGAVCLCPPSDSNQRPTAPQDVSRTCPDLAWLQSRPTGTAEQKPACFLLDGRTCAAGCRRSSEAAGTRIWSIRLRGRAVQTLGPSGVGRLWDSSWRPTDGRLVLTRAGRRAACCAATAPPTTTWRRHVDSPPFFLASFSKRVPYSTRPTSFWLLQVPILSLLCPVVRAAAAPIPLRRQDPPLTLPRIDV